MENVLIVSGTEESVALFTEILNMVSVRHITVLCSDGEARRLLLKQDFDLVIVNAPLSDGCAESLSRHIAQQTMSQVILAVNSKDAGAVSAVCDDNGVLTISKPLNSEYLCSVFSLVKFAGNRVKRVQAENAKLKHKIDDIRVIDRAKCLLISHLKLSEQEAHRFIEKQAMDIRSSKRAIAEGILKTYAN